MTTAAATSIRCSLRPVRAVDGVTVALLATDGALDGKDEGRATAGAVDAAPTTGEPGGAAVEALPGPAGDTAPCGGMIALGPPGGTVVVVLWPGCASATLGHAARSKAKTATRLRVMNVLPSAQNAT